VKPVPVWPLILIALDLCAAVAYWRQRDRYAGLYWAFAAGISWCAVQMARGAK